MLKKYNLTMPKNIYAGQNALENIEQVLKENNINKIAVFTDKGIVASGIIEIPLSYIKRSNKEVVIIDYLTPEPTVEQVQSVVDDFKKSQADFIIAIGGGSVMDTAKLASVLTSDFTIRDILNDASKAKKSIKTLMIPTTAGTGAEATPNAIVAVPEKELKVGIVSNSMIADYVILDVEMIKKLPAKIAASTGLDALSHAIECYTSKKANLISNTFALEALKIIINNLEAACLDPDALDAKEHMLLGSFYAGVAITSSGTTAVHALSYPLGGKYHIPHGVSNAIMLVPVMKFNEPFCQDQFAKIYDLIDNADLTLSPEIKSQRLIEKLCYLVEKLDIPANLRDYNVSSADLDFLVDAGMQVQRLLVNNKREVTHEDARKLYLEVL